MQQVQQVNTGLASKGSSIRHQQRIEAWQSDDSDFEVVRIEPSQRLSSAGHGIS